MNDERKQVDKVLQEFHGQLMTEDEGFIAPDFIAMARALIEARVERDAEVRWQREMLQDYRIGFDDHPVGRRLGINQLVQDLIARHCGAFEAEADTLRTQLADVEKAMHVYRKSSEEKGTQLAAARVVTDAMVERAWVCLEFLAIEKQLGMLNGIDKEDVQIALTAALSEAP